MARVTYHDERYDIEDEVLDIFFSNVIGEGEDLTEYLGSLQTEKRLALQDFIVYRLAEVSPGYVGSA